ncbi:hypothetical protein QUB09_08055 [Microcoleus sp. C2C6]
MRSHYLHRLFKCLWTSWAHTLKVFIAQVLAELEDDRRCDRAFARSLDTLAKLAAPAMAEYHAGKTHELDPETL